MRGDSPAVRTGSPTVSLIICNHNYGRFLGEAIDSALRQTYARTEVIVVDDGSTDDSRRIIERFGDRIRPVLKENGGQASAFNAGISASRGDFICFQDSDDTNRPERAERLLELFARLPQDMPTMLFHRLANFGERTTKFPVVPSSHRNLSGGRLKGTLFRITDPEESYRYAGRYAYLPFIAPPTSGVAINRSLVERLFPIPETHQVGADCVIVRGGMLAGEVYGTDEVLGDRRLHKNNHSRLLQKHLADKRFLDSMNVYMNRILETAGMEPVISVFDSIGARTYYEHSGSWRSLLRLAYRIPLKHPSPLSLRYGFKALGSAISTALARRR